MRHESKQYLKKLLNNKKFLDWILFPSEETNSYWQKKIENEPERADDIQSLKKVIESLEVKESSLSELEKNGIWNEIENSTILRDKKTSRLKLFFISSAASVAIFVVGYLFFNLQNTDSGIDYESYITEATSINSTEIELVVAGDRVISLDEDSVNLVYDENGGVSVNASQLNEEQATEINQLTVPYGKSSTLVLSDGSKVYINSGSKLLYPASFEKDKREIYVDGEVFLEVTKDKNRPFIVKTSQLEVNVLGTSFNVKAYNNTTEEQAIVLVEGLVAVNSKDVKKKHNLKPNQMFRYNKENNISSIESVDATNYTAWIHGYILCERTPLDEILWKLKRYYNIEINYDALDMRNIRATGKLDLKTGLDDVLAYISMIAPIRYNLENDKYTISRIDK